MCCQQHWPGTSRLLRRRRQPALSACLNSTCSCWHGWSRSPRWAVYRVPTLNRCCALHVSAPRGELHADLKFSFSHPHPFNPPQPTSPHPSNPHASRTSAILWQCCESHCSRLAARPACLGGFQLTSPRRSPVRLSSGASAHSSGRRFIRSSADLEAALEGAEHLPGQHCVCQVSAAPCQASFSAAGMQQHGATLLLLYEQLLQAALACNGCLTLTRFW